MTMPLKIEKLYAWISEEKDGAEGVCGATFQGLGFVPLIGADRERIESYRERATQIANATGVSVKLKMFAAVTTIDEIGPADVG